MKHLRIVGRRYGDKSMQVLIESLTRRYGVVDGKSFFRYARTPYSPSLVERGDDVVELHWGCGFSVPPPSAGEHFSYNDPSKVCRSINKWSCLAMLKQEGVPTVDFTRDRDDATRWWDAGLPVFIRMHTRGSASSGLRLAWRQVPATLQQMYQRILSHNVRIVNLTDEQKSQIADRARYVLNENVTPLPAAPLYTTFDCPVESREFRVLCAPGFTRIPPVVMQKKRAQSRFEEETYDPVIKDELGGWLYTRATLDAALTELAHDALTVMSLDFGAVDIIKHPTGGYFVLEINSAPALDRSDERNWARTILSRICDTHDITSATLGI